MEYDIIILGSGPSGLTSGIYASRCNLKTLIIGKVFGGLVSEIPLIENYPGFSSISGPELVSEFKKQIDFLKINFRKEEIVDVKKINNGFEIRTDKGNYKSKVLIFALGSEKRKLNVPGEKKFSGKGVSYCVMCDGPLFKNKTIAVIGGGDSAVLSALFMTKHAKKIYMIDIEEKPRAKPLMLEQLKNLDVEILSSYKINKIKGKNFVESLEIEKVKWKNGKFEGTGDKKEIKCDGIFVEIGIVPSTALVKNLNIELEKGFIKVNEKMETSQKGIFASGDITSGNLKQIVIASAQGAIAALSAYNYLKNLKNV